jgi:hypothetical protein
MAILTRATIPVIAAGLSVDALGTIWTPTGPRGVVPFVCTLTAPAAGGALLWALRWPTRAVAIRFAVAAAACIALIALAQHPRSQQLCDVIAALPFGITASIGAAGIHPAHRAGGSVDLPAELIAAEAASGGGRSGFHRVVWPHTSRRRRPRLDSFDADESDYRSDGLTA